MRRMSRTHERIARWHALSGLLISSFTALHLMNHAAAFGGPVAWAAFRALLRRIYQVPAIEILVLGLPILFNVASGIWLAAQPRTASPMDGIRPLRRRLHRASGIVLVCLVLFHALSTRGAALIYRIDPDFYYIATMLAGARGIAWWGFYALLVTAAAYHVANGLFTLLDDAGTFPGPRARAAGAAALILVGTTLMLAGMLGLFSFGGVTYPRPSVETLPLD